MFSEDDLEKLWKLLEEVTTKKQLKEIRLALEEIDRGCGKLFSIEPDQETLRAHPELAYKARELLICFAKHMELELVIFVRQAIP